MITLTEEQLKKIIEDAFLAGANYQTGETKMNTILEMLGDGFGRFVLALMALSIGLLVLVAKSEIDKQREWEEFTATHVCKVVAHVEGDIFIEDKTGWACDDGVTYYR